MGDEGGGGGGERSPADEESPMKKCCFCLLDVIATTVRTFVAIGKGIQWASQRCCYPVKEATFGCTDRVHKWYMPVFSKMPAKGVPGFQYGV